MTDATLHLRARDPYANGVRLRARFASGEALVEELRRDGAVNPLRPTGTYRRVWPHQLAIPGRDIADLKALVAALPLAVFAGDPDEAPASAGPAPRSPLTGAAGAPSPRARPAAEPARRGFLAAHYSFREET